MEYCSREVAGCLAVHVESLEDALVIGAVGTGLVQSKVGVASGLMMILAEKTVAAIGLYVVAAADDDTAAADVAVVAFAAAVAVNTPEWPHQICIQGLWPSWRAVAQHWHQFLVIELALTLGCLIESPLALMSVGVAALEEEG